MNETTSGPAAFKTLSERRASRKINSSQAVQLANHSRSLSTNQDPEAFANEILEDVESEHPPD